MEDSEGTIKEWLNDWDLDEVITDIFYDHPPDIKGFKKVLDKLLSNIVVVRKIPLENRKFDLW